MAVAEPIIRIGGDLHNIYFWNGFYAGLLVTSNGPIPFRSPGPNDGNPCCKLPKLGRYELEINGSAMKSNQGRNVCLEGIVETCPSGAQILHVYKVLS